jgi:hypothetical protein
MSEQSELTLRKSLDEVDRVRRWQIGALVVLVVLLLLQYAGQHYVGSAENQCLNVKTGEYTRLFFTVVLTLLGVSIYVNRMTRKILKAVEVLSKSKD